MNACIENQALALCHLDEGPYFGMEIVSNDPPIGCPLNFWEIFLQFLFDHLGNNFEDDEPKHDRYDPFQLVKGLFVNDRLFCRQSPQISNAPGFEEMGDQAGCRDADEEAGEIACELVIQVS